MKGPLTDISPNDQECTAPSGLVDPGFFEGAEKLVELWYTPCAGEEKSLRCIPREKLEEVLSLVKCAIIGGSQQEKVDSYVLSESSMFVFDDKIILKTCGTTTLLQAIPVLMDLAKVVCGRDGIRDMFYTRRNFVAPNEQRFPHRSFDEEVAFLNKYFDGAAYTLGRLNGNVWYLYTLNSKTPEVPPPDQTLEIMMRDLDPSAMSLYYRQANGPSAADVTTLSGIAQLLPGAHCDAALFDPCGYSVNGVREDAYFTIHVTPQPSCSYVSFETNVQLPAYTDLIDKVLRMFRPKTATVTLLASRTALCGAANQAYNCRMFENLDVSDRQICEFHNYNLAFTQLERR